MLSSVLWAADSLAAHTPAGKVRRSIPLRADLETRETKVWWRALVKNSGGYILFQMCSNCAATLQCEPVSAVTAWLDSQINTESSLTTVIMRRHLLCSKAGGKLTFHYGNGGRAKKENGERGSDVSLQEMIGALHAHVWVKAAEQYAWSDRAEIPKTSTKIQATKTCRPSPELSLKTGICSREAGTLGSLLFFPHTIYLIKRIPCLCATEWK